MNIILFDTDRENLYPLTFTRPISDFRVGIVSIKQKWEFYYKSVSVKTVDYLSEKYPIHLQKNNVWIDSSILPSQDLITEINSLRNGEFLENNGDVIAVCNHDMNT